MGGPSGRPRRLRGLAPGPSLLAANLNCPGFFISKAGVNRPPPPRAAVETGALLRHDTCCATASVHAESQLHSGRRPALGPQHKARFSP